MKEIYIDSPQNAEILYPVENVWGWINIPKIECNQIDFFLNSFPIAFSVTNRPDLDQSQAFGFSIYLDIPTLFARRLWVPQERLTLELRRTGSVIARRDLAIGGVHNSEVAQFVEDRKAKREFLRSVLSDGISIQEDMPVNGLPSSWHLSSALSEKKDPVSAHFYGPAIQEFLNSIRPGGYVLDAGAGLRRLPYPRVINMEIYEYPSTDVLGIGQKLPFKSNSFDAVLSLAVLEHVDDPVKCAEEIARVLKPGGRVFTMMPFLQGEHGYPYHFFNATRSGLRQLFKMLDVERQFLEMSNHPINMLEEVLSIYANGLPGMAREEFLSMSIGDILSTSATQKLMQNSSITSQLSESAQWAIASGTSAIFVKQ